MWAPQCGEPSSKHRPCSAARQSTACEVIALWSYQRRCSVNPFLLGTVGLRLLSRSEGGPTTAGVGSGPAPGSWPCYSADLHHHAMHNQPTCSAGIPLKQHPQQQQPGPSVQTVRQGGVGTVGKLIALSGETPAPPHTPAPPAAHQHHLYQRAHTHTHTHTHIGAMVDVQQLVVWHRQQTPTTCSIMCAH